MDNSNNSNKALPQFVKGEYFWEGEINLPSWAGYRSCRGPYGAQDSAAPSGGQISIIANESENEQALSQEQSEACLFLLKHDTVINEVVIRAILEKYPELYGIFSDYAADNGVFMPELMTREELKNHIGVTNIHLHAVEKNGVGYVGIELGCSWDDEHGLGLMLHETTVVDIGGADTSILGWIAQRHKDGG